MIPPHVAVSLQAMVLLAAGDRMPSFSVEPICKGIAEQGGVTFSDPRIAQEKKNCIGREQVVREQVAKQWSSFLPADRTHCVNETMMGGQSSYTELLTCLEMARDARAMRTAAAASRQAAATSVPSSSSPGRGEPTRVEPAVPQRSASEPAKRQIDSTLKQLELEKAKKDAENATASEALARRKLADLETALQRAREEAGQASKDAERAKADAELARELQAQAERHFAEAATARLAAEEREKACHSATNRPGLGARIRGWLKR
jgi:hypothetical protein